MKIPTAIKNAIKENNLVVFAGAGVTKNIGLPEWRDLAVEIINYLNNNNEYENLINRLRTGENPINIFNSLEKEHKVEIKQYISKNFNLSNSNSFQVQKSILKLTSQIITTNYDTAFESAYIQMYDEKFPNIAIQNLDRLNLMEIVRSNEFLFKLHGCATHPESCAIFSSDYTKIYKKDSPTLFLLKSLAMQKKILFVGFSFNDITLRKIFYNQARMFDGCLKHFILTPSPQIFKDCNFLTPIKLNYGEITNAFTELANFKEPIIEKKNTEVINQLKETLANSPLFEDVTSDGIASIASNSNIYTLSKEDYLCRSGDEVRSFWFIWNGDIAAKKNGITTTIRTTGDIVGELGLLEKRSKRSSDLIANKHKTRVVEIELSVIHELIPKNQMNIWRNLASILGDKIEKQDFMICEIKQLMYKYRNDSK